MMMKMNMMMMSSFKWKKYCNLSSRDVLHLCLQSIGPSSTITLITSSLNTSPHFCTDIQATSSSRILFQQVVLRENASPSCMVILSALRSHNAHHSDAGLFLVSLSLLLVLKTFDADGEGAIAHASVAECEQALQICQQVTQWSIAYWRDSPSCKCRITIDWSKRHQLIALVSSVLTKRLSRLTNAHIELIANILINALLSALPHHESEMNTLRKRVKILPVVTKSILKSEYFEGLLIDVKNISLPMSAYNLRVALFTVSLMCDNEDTDASNHFIANDTIMKVAQHRQLLEFCNVCVTNKVGFVACQKLIHPVLKAALKRHNIVCMESLSLLHIRDVALVCGGTPMSSASFTHTMNTKHFGHLDSLETIQRCNRRYYKMYNAKRPFATVFLCTNDAVLSREIIQNVSCALDILCVSLRAPIALAGAGVCEIFLAHHLRCKIEDWRLRRLNEVRNEFALRNDTEKTEEIDDIIAERIHRFRHSMKLKRVTNSMVFMDDAKKHHTKNIVNIVYEFADCLERYATAQALPYMSHREAVEILRQRNDVCEKNSYLHHHHIEPMKNLCCETTEYQPQTFYGWNNTTCKFDSNNVILDSISCKISALKSAIDATLSLIRAGVVIRLPHTQLQKK